MQIHNLKVGQSAKIKDITNTDYLHKLHAMGIITGCDIMLLRYSPANDLVMLKISGNFVALNTKECNYIELEV